MLPRGIWDEAASLAVEIEPGGSSEAGQGGVAGEAVCTETFEDCDSISAVAAREVVEVDVGGACETPIEVSGAVSSPISEDIALRGVVLVANHECARAGDLGVGGGDAFLEGGVGDQGFERGAGRVGFHVGAVDEWSGGIGEEGGDRCLVAAAREIGVEGGERDLGEYLASRDIENDGGTSEIARWLVFAGWEAGLDLGCEF